MFPEPLKGVLVSQDHNKEKAEACFKDFGFKVLVTGSHCLGGFISNEAKQRKWVEEKAQTWIHGCLKCPRWQGDTRKLQVLDSKNVSSRNGNS
jgi:hypothetical protein